MALEETRLSNHSKQNNMSYKKKDNTASTMRGIGALMIVLAWVFGWMPDLGLFLFVGGVVLMLASIFFN
jgi:hypothetical protein